MPKRLLKWGNANPSLLVLVMSGLIVSVGIGAQAHQSAKRDDADRAEVVARTEQIASSAIQTCKTVVLAVTGQVDSDLLDVLDAIEASAAEQGHAAPGWVRQLRFVINNRRPPLDACIPKEKP